MAITDKNYPVITTAHDDIFLCIFLFVGDEETLHQKFINKQQEQNMNF